MTSPKDQAFPRPGYNYRLSNPAMPGGEELRGVEGNGGMTLRAYFAAKAMQGVLAYYGPNDMESSASKIVGIADALLAELSKPTGEEA